MANGTIKVSQVDVLTTSGTGTISIVPPATNTNRTLTLPDQTATVATLTTPSFGTTIGVGGATASASGAGVSFPATQSASTDANTLDDYEEGTFTPTLKFGGATTGITYTAQKGRYTKIGRSVTVSIAIQLSNKGSSTGLATITLPFASDEYGSPDVPGYSSGFAYYSNMVTATKAAFIVGNIGAAGYVTASSSTTGNPEAYDTNFANNTTFVVTVTYNTST